MRVTITSSLRSSLWFPIKKDLYLWSFDSRPGAQESYAPCLHPYIREALLNSSKRKKAEKAENVLIHVFFVKMKVPILKSSEVHVRACQKTRTEVVKKSCFRASDVRVRGSKVLFLVPSQNGNASVNRVFYKKT